MASEPRRLVLVDAEAVKKAREYIRELAFDAVDEPGAELYELAHDLAPVLPELPEGCRETERSGHALRVMRGGTTYGISSHGIWNARMGVGHWTPNDIAQYLLAHWAAKEAT